MARPPPHYVIRCPLTEQIVPADISGVTSALAICAICAACVAGIPYALPKGMDLLGRLCAVVGISLVITLLLLVLYQDDAAGVNNLEPVPMTDAATSSTAHGGTP